MTRRRPALGEYIPFVGGLWLVVCATFPPAWFAGYFLAVNHALWSLTGIEIVYAAVIAAAAQLGSMFSTNGLRRRLAYVSAIAWLFVAVLLFVADIPLGGGFAALIMFRLLAVYWESPHGG